MSTSPRAWPLAGLLAALCLSCRNASPAAGSEQRPAAPPRSAPARAAFTPPSADGFGEAAGLRYLELLRGGARAEQTLPMLVMIHGLGDRPREAWIGELPLPVRVIMPQAPRPHHGGFSWFDYRVRDQQPEQLARGIRRAAAQLARALSLLQRERPTRGLPVVSGFSQGGMLAYALALHHPEVVAHAVPIAGMLPQPLWPKRAPGGRTPAIEGLHGTADAVVPIGPTRSLIAHLQKLGYRADLREFAGVGHRIPPPMERAMVELTTKALKRQPESRE